MPRVRTAAALAATGLASAASAQSAEDAWRAETGFGGPYVVIQEDDAPRPPFEFSADDEALLDEIQHATFRWFWESPELTDAGMIPDRSSNNIVSIAGLGYQLGAICVGVERGYITRDQGETRAKQIIETLLRRADQISKNGVYYHFLNGDTALSQVGWDGVSTIDTSILFAGVLTAGAYFGGEVMHLSKTMVAAADWTFFLLPAGQSGVTSNEAGMVSLLWSPDDWANNPTGPGSLAPVAWLNSGDEERLIYFIAQCGPNPAFRPDPSTYYRLYRNVGAYNGSGPMIFSSGGALFTTFFAHLWIDYNGIAQAQGPDRPDLAENGGFGFRAPTDWWENSRRHARMHKQKAVLDNPGFATVSEDSWGMSASDGPTGYNVPGLHPDPLPMPGAVPWADILGATQTDRWLNGTVAPYTAGSTIMFEPEAAVAALRHYRGLTTGNGAPLLWGDEYGFFDAYNLDTTGPGGGPWVAPDRVGIDQGPLLLAIENARTGLLWNTFHQHPYVADAMGRLGLTQE